MSYWYLATPYTKYPDGIDAAFKLACEQAGLLIKAGVPVHSPIAHTHPIAIQCGFDPLDVDLWIEADRPMMEAAKGIIMLKAESWEKSKGMAIEHDTFVMAGKPVIWMEPEKVPFELLRVEMQDV